ncbi:MAG TPA: putative Fe-S cluster assembly protein SufT [Terriglobales bacterium]|nr:putative Fe-S cluster assembly protein SufT [Terriglobales bacterium]
MSTSQTSLSRTVEVIEIPSGYVSTLPEGTPVRIMQSRGDSYTVWTDYGQMYRIDGKDADAIGLQTSTDTAEAQDSRQFTDQMVWDVLKTVYDPEIPVNIVDLGLIYSCKISALEQDSRKIDIQMSMTAPGCGMGNILKADVESRLSRLPSVKEVHVEVVFDPPWDMSRMSEAARLQLGF